MIDEIELQNTIADLRDEISDMERQISNLEDRLDISSGKEDSYDGILIYIKDRQEHAEAMGDEHAVEIYKDILKRN